MRNTLLFCSAMVLLFLASCGGRTVYVHPERTPQQEEKDYYECAYEAQKSTGNLDDESDREERIEQIIESCMRSKGYSR